MLESSEIFRFIIDSGRWNVHWDLSTKNQSLEHWQWPASFLWPWYAKKWPRRKLPDELDARKKWWWMRWDAGGNHSSHRFIHSRTMIRNETSLMLMSAEFDLMTFHSLRKTTVDVGINTRQLWAMNFKLSSVCCFFF